MILVKFVVVVVKIHLFKLGYITVHKHQLRLTKNQMKDINIPSSRNGGGLNLHN